jgi:hypothetical protein
VPRSQTRHPPRRSKKFDGDTVGTAIVAAAIADATVPRRNADIAPDQAESAEIFWRLVAVGRGSLLAPREDPIYWLSGRLFPAGVAPVVDGGVDAVTGGVQYRKLGASMSCSLVRATFSLTAFASSELTAKGPA